MYPALFLAVLMAAAALTPSIILALIIMSK